MIESLKNEKNFIHIGLLLTWIATQVKTQGAVTRSRNLRNFRNATFILTFTFNFIHLTPLIINEEYVA